MSQFSPTYFPRSSGQLGIIFCGEGQLGIVFGALNKAYNHNVICIIND